VSTLNAKLRSLNCSMPAIDLRRVFFPTQLEHLLSLFSCRCNSNGVWHRLMTVASVEWLGASVFSAEQRVNKICHEADDSKSDADANARLCSRTQTVIHYCSRG